MGGECTSSVIILMHPMQRVIQNQFRTFRTEIIKITTLEIKLQWLHQLCGTSLIFSLRTLPT